MILQVSKFNRFPIFLQAIKISRFIYFFPRFPLLKKYKKYKNTKKNFHEKYIPLPGMSEVDDIIKQRLLVDGEGTLEDKKLQHLQKTII